MPPVDHDYSAKLPIAERVDAAAVMVRIERPRRQRQRQRHNADCALLRRHCHRAVRLHAIGACATARPQPDRIPLPARDARRFGS